MEGDSRNPRVSLLKKYDIPIDHLSFEYVETCTDKKELERIARILRSGEEGIYPDLINTVENKLRQIAPESRVLRVETPAPKKDCFTVEEWKEFEKDLEVWESEMRVLDSGLDYEKKRFDTIGNKNLPEVRKVIEPKPVNMVDKDIGVSKIKVETKKKCERIKSGDYAAWDKFDVDKELLRIDLEDEREEEKNSKIKREMEKQAKKTEEKKSEPINIDPDSYSDLEQQILASQAKDRGNECFKSGDYEQALKYYKVSLKLFPTTATYNNRAMTYIKMKNFEEALRDCNEVLKREPNNIKALHRRATSYQNLPGEHNNELALRDLTQIVYLEPSNRVAQTDLQVLKNKLSIQNIGRKFRMMIEESGSDELREFLSTSNNVKKSSNDEDDIDDIRKLPLTYYGPSTSTFKCEPQSMTHRMLSDPNFSGRILCKCNSNATRQNPLCYTCGERLSRPKQKPKTKKPKTDVEVNANGCENPEPEVKTENEPKSVVKEENEKPEPQTDAIEENPGCSSSHSHENSNGLESDLVIQIRDENVEDKEVDNVQDKEAGEQNNNEVESITKAGAEEERVCEKDGSEGLVNMMNDLKIEEKTNEDPGRANYLNGDANAGVDEKKEINGNSLSLRESDVNGIEGNDCSEGSEEKNVDDSNLTDGKVQLNNSDNGETVVCQANGINDDEKLTENDNNCLPSTSNQTEPGSETKKSRNKKRRSRESRTDGIPFLYAEPVKIVQAPKYLKPTSSEPRPEPDKPKEESNASEDRSQFKTFVPGKKCPGAEGGILTPNTSQFTVNQREKDSRTPQEVSPPGNMKGDCEGNKENISENVHDQNNFKTFHSGDDVVPVTSSFEFMKSWESVRKSDESYEQRAQMIRFLRPEDLKKVIGNNLDSDMLKSLLECLEKHFLDNDPKKVTSFLKELPRIPRFSIINLFLSQNEREVLQRLIDKTEKKGYVLDEEVKNSLKASF